MVVRSHGRTLEKLVAAKLGPPARRWQWPGFAWIAPPAQPLKKICEKFVGL